MTQESCDFACRLTSFYPNQPHSSGLPDWDDFQTLYTQKSFKTMPIRFQFLKAAVQDMRYNQ